MTTTSTSRLLSRMSHCLVVLLGTLLASPPNEASDEAQRSREGPDKPVATVSTTVPRPPEYVIGPGDVLQVFVWKEGELTRDVTVRSDGMITVPLLGDVPAAGRTPQQLGTELSRSLARFLASPQVTVGVGQANARFYVVGQVARPGDFPLTGRMTVIQGLALAGGLREFARADGILIIRPDQGKEIFIPVNYKKLEDGKDISQNVTLRPGDTILVP